MRVPTDHEILALDDELASEGVPLDDRANQALQRWLKRTDWSGEFIPIAKHFEERFRVLHPSVNLGGKPFMFLCASARGIAYEYHPPIVFGQVKVSPTDPLRISQSELERIWNADQDSYWELFWQCCDCFDLFSAHMDNVITEPEGLNFASAAKDQLQASARQLVAIANDASLAQACALSTELAGKAVLRQLGHGDVRALGHNVTTIYAELIRQTPACTDGEVQAAAQLIPGYVNSRYSPPSLSTPQAQRLFATALFLCSDAFRRLCRQSMYFDAFGAPSVPNRNWA